MSDASTEAMQIKFLGQGHNKLMQQRVERSICVTRNRLVALVTNMPKCKQY